MWDFARRPRWILSHLLVLVLILVMINLGFWQLRRLDEKTTLNDHIRARGSLPTESIEALVPAGSTRASTRDVQWRRVVATGTYRVADELVVSNRTVSGQPGFWVLTPLVERDGSIIPVVRGFVFRPEFEARGIASVPAPAGEVTIEGALQASPTSGRFGDEPSSSGRVPAISQADTKRLAERWGPTVAPVYLRLDAGDGAPSKDGPLYPVPPPPLSKGPHLSYAVQWFIFSLIGLIGYPIILRRQAYGRDRSADDDWPAEVTNTTDGQETARQNGAAQGTIV
jgi:cytochrome oxidase assembly protein ShyY1